MTPILGWSRPIGETKYHAIVRLDDSAHTACSGRWSRREPSEFLDGRDRDVDHSGSGFDKCPACESSARIERTEEGLDELARVMEHRERIDELEIEIRGLYGYGVVDLRPRFPWGDA